MKTNHRPPARTPARQRGVAVVVAVLVVALATSTVAFVLWQQSLWLRQVENLTGRAQVDAVARAAAGWGAAILAADDRNIDALTEAWARPIPPLPAERAELAGAIVDEQGKFNVNNLVRGGAASAVDVAAYQGLLTALGLSGALAETLVDWLDPDDNVTQPNGAEDLYYLGLEPPYRAANRRIVDIAELVRVKGYSPEIVARLAPHITALPVDTAINVNTATVNVLQAIIPSLGAAEAGLIVETRKTQPYRDIKAFLGALSKPPGNSIDALVDVKSRFFSADVTVRLDRIVTGYHVLYDRGDRNVPTVAQLSPLAF